MTASQRSVNWRFTPYAFTENGIAMLSGVLKTERAIQVHISIIRVFFRMREVLRTNSEFTEKLENIEKNTDRLFKVVFERLDDLETVKPPVLPKRKIGF